MKVVIWACVALLAASCAEEPDRVVGVKAGDGRRKPDGAVRELARRRAVEPGFLAHSGQRNAPTSD